MGRIRLGSVQLDRRVIPVQQDSELVSFAACFHGWCDWSMRQQPFVDPWAVRCEVRVSLGLVGEARLGKVARHQLREIEDDPDSGIGKGDLLRGRRGTLVIPRAPATEDVIRSRFRSATKSSMAKKKEPATSSASSSSSPNKSPWSIKSPDRSLIATPLFLDDPPMPSAGEKESPRQKTEKNCSPGKMKQQGALRLTKGLQTHSKKKLFSTFTSPMSSPQKFATNSGAVVAASPLQRLRDRLRGGGTKAGADSKGCFSPMGMRGGQVGAAGGG